MLERALSYENKLSVARLHSFKSPYILNKDKVEHRDKSKCR